MCKNASKVQEISLFRKVITLLGTIKKGKEPRNRPGVAQRVAGGLGSQIFMTFGT
jgi:hypothetical protein